MIGLEAVIEEQKRSRCLGLLQAGAHGTGGDLPVCFGETCNAWRVCIHDRLKARVETDLLMRKPAGQRVLKEWGKR